MNGIFQQLKGAGRRSGNLSEASGAPRQRGKWTRLLTALPLLVFAGAGQAALEVTPIVAYNLIVDSNVLSPSTYAPEAFTAGAKVCNTDASGTRTNVTLYTGDYDNNRKGYYPLLDCSSGFGAGCNYAAMGNTRSDPSAHLNDSGFYSFTHQSKSVPVSQDATRFVGNLAAGACRVEYWVVTYPQTSADAKSAYNTAPGSYSPLLGREVSVTGGSIKGFDDLQLRMDFWATSTEGNSAAVKHKLTMRNEISASANKLWPNGDNKVPDNYKEAIARELGWDTTDSVGNPRSSAYPGEVITVAGIWYDLGNVGDGFDNNGDLVPDRNLWMQPVGDAGVYDPGCFRLVRSYGLVIVKLTDGTDRLYPFVDKLYFENVPENNNGAVGLVYYEYIALDGVCTAALSPYQEVASGRDNEKFSGDYGAAPPPIITKAPAVTFDKTERIGGAGGWVDGPQNASAGNTLNYNVDFANAGPVDIGNLEYSMPVVLRDTIPAGAKFKVGTVGSTMPSGVTAEVRYTSDNGLTWTTTAPATQGAADLVDEIQWWLSAPLVPGASGTVSLDVIADNPTTAGFIDNVASIGLGNAPVMLQDNAITLVGTRTISGYVFHDNGATGGIKADGIKNGAEAGLTPVKVSLYYDDPTKGRVLVKTDDSDGTGYYEFLNMPASNLWILVVDQLDADLPAGSAPTNSVERDTPDTTAGNSTTTPGTLGNDFGFLAPLIVTKTLSGSSPVNEGTNVTFDIGVKNDLVKTVGTPVNGGTQCEFMYYATSFVGASWTNAGNVNGPADGDYAVFTYSSAGSGTASAFVADSNGSDLSAADNGAGTASVYWEMVFRATTTAAGFDGAAGGRGNDRQNLVVGTFNQNLLASTINSDLANGVFPQTSSVATYQVDVSGGSATWGTARPNAVLTDAKVGANDFKTTDAASIGYRITVNRACNTTPVAATTNTIMDPVPLVDTYDATKLEFVSATPPIAEAPSSGTLKWSNIGPINPGVTKTVSVTFKTIAPASPTTNTAWVYSKCDADPAKAALGAAFQNGKCTNADDDPENVTITDTAKISGVVWWDKNGGNGATLDLDIPSAEPRLSGVSLGLYTDTACTTRAPAPANVDVITDSIGYYEFRVATNTTFYVCLTSATLPTGFAANQTWDRDAEAPITSGHRATVTIAGMADVTNAHFGYDMNNNLINGKIWWDQDGDACDDPTAAAVGNCTVDGHSDTVVETPTVGTDWQVSIYNNGTCSGGAASTDNLDSSGNYQFSNLADGTYCVKVTTVKTNWSQTMDPTSGYGETGGASCYNTAACDLMKQTIVVSGGNIYSGNDFGFQKFGTSVIGNSIYQDIDGDGRQDIGEPGIGGVTLKLYWDANNDGLIDLNNDYLRATTISSANGRMVNVVGGSLDLDGNGSIDAGGTKDDGVYLGYVVEDGVLKVTAGGADLNRSGFGIEGYQVIGGQLDTDFSTGIGGGDSGTVTDPGTVNVYDGMLDMNHDGVADTNDDFGTFHGYVVTNGCLGGACGAGLTTGSIAIEGIEVFSGYLDMDFDNTGAADTGDDGTVTAATGWYQFTGLLDGNYIVAVDETSAALQNHTQTSDPDEPAQTTDADTVATLCTTCNALGSSSVTAATDNTVDFGYKPTGGSIGDTIYWDANGNAIQDGSEVGIGGVTVKLYTQTYTDANSNGRYDAGWMDGGTVGTYEVGEDGEDLVVGTLTDTGRTQVTDASGWYQFTALGANSRPRNVYDGKLDLNGDGAANGEDDGLYFGYRVIDGLIDVNGVDNITGADNLADNLAPWGKAVVAGYIDFIPGGVVADDDGYLSRGQVYVVEVVTSTLPGATAPKLTADPEVDGDPRIGPTGQYVCDGTDGTIWCDGWTRVFIDGNDFMGADFGYQSLGVVGDRVWLDANGDGNQYIAGAAVLLDDGVLPGGTTFFQGYPVIGGKLDINGSGGIDENDDLPAIGTDSAGGVYGYRVIDGYIDLGGGGVDNPSGPLDSGTNVNDDGNVYPVASVESGIGNVTVTLYRESGATAGYQLAQDIGVQATVITDANGYYYFSNLPNGTYWIVVNGADLPNGAGTPVTYNLDSGTAAVAYKNHITGVVIAGGLVTQYVRDDNGAATNVPVGGDPLPFDFGYKLGTYTINGTVCIDETAGANGYCGVNDTTYSGADVDEAGRGGYQVTFYKWTDDGDTVAWDGSGVLDPNDTFELIGSTTTISTAGATKGDYSMSNLPANVVVVLSINGGDMLKLNTTSANMVANDAANNDAETENSFYETTTTESGTTVTLVAKAAFLDLGTKLAGGGGTTLSDVDFAFESRYVGYDYGDLPSKTDVPSLTSSFPTTLKGGGASHLIPYGGATIYLGSVPPQPSDDGDPSPNATFDDGTNNDAPNEEDGVELKLAGCTTTGCTVRATVTATGKTASDTLAYVMGFVDYDKSGSFNNSNVNETAIDATRLTASTGGTATPLYFNFPTTTQMRGDLFARFRLFRNTTGTNSLAYMGSVVDGEVEDYKWTLNWDYGDALDATYATNYSAAGGKAGPRHLIDGNALYIGAAVTSEWGDTSSSTNADADTDDGLLRFWIEQGAGVNDDIAYAVIKITNSTNKPAQVAGWFDHNCSSGFDNGGSSTERSSPDVDIYTSWTNKTTNVPYSGTENGDQDWNDGFWKTGNVPASSGALWYRLKWTGWEKSCNSSFVRIRLTSDGILKADGTLETVQANRTGFFKDGTPFPDGPVVGGEVEDSPVNITPTYASIESFGLYTDGSAVVANWNTAAEEGTLGFHLERQEPLTGRWERVNGALLDGLLFAPEGGSYYYRDSGARSGVDYTYRLIEVEVDGDEIVHGPWVTRASGKGKAISKGYEKSAKGKDSATLARFEASKVEQAKGKSKATNSAALRLKVSLPGSGPVALPMAPIAKALNISEKDIANLGRYGVTVTSEGKPVGVTLSEDKKSLVIYNSGFESPFTKERVFWIEKGAVTTMAKIDAKASGADPTASYVEERWFEQDTNYFVSGTTPTDTGLWYWGYVAQSGQTTFTAPFDLFNPLPGAATAKLQVELHGGTNQAYVTDHNVALELNGHALGSVTWDGMTAKLASFDVPQDWLLHGGNNLKLTAAKPGSGFLMLDKIGISYRRSMVAINNVLTVNVNKGQVVSATGFTSSNISVLNVTDPIRPREVKRLNATGSGQSWGVNFVAPMAGRYVVYTAEARSAVAPEAVVPVASSWLKSERVGVSHLIIAPGIFADAAQELADYRTSSGTSSRVVTLEDIYNEFSYGHPTPYAIRDFLALATENWRVKPHYAMLAGKGSIDVFNRMGYAANLIPVVTTASSEGVFASDNRLGDVAGNDGVPEVVIGRVPAVTSSELTAFIKKLIAYEGQVSGDWSRNVAMVSDLPDAGGDFVADSDSVADLFSADYDLNRFYRSREVTESQVNQLLTSELVAGTGVLNYIGHGNFFGLGKSIGILNRNHVWQLPATPRLPLVMAMSCMINRFELPGVVSLGEALVLSKGGAIASFSTTAKSINSDALALNEALVDTLFTQEGDVLGDAVWQALSAASGTLSNRFMWETYSIMGDPATVIRKQ